jgi:2-hydroxycyclohexanecarboxyl-CoA dehydrogenase
VDLGLAERSVIVTGGASNIGQGIARAFAAEGALVCIADRDAEQAQRVASEVPGVTAEVTDVTDPDSVAALVRGVITRAGHVDVLVNAAGWVMDRLFVEQPPEEWRREIDVNFWGFLNCTRAVLDSMIERRQGSIVSISSDAGRMGEFREAVYSGTKAAVIASSKAIAREVGRHGVRLNVVCPGLVPPRPEMSGKESMWRGELGGMFTEEVLQRVVRAYPLGRLGTPEDVAAAVLFLASDRASYITGQTLSVDGGYVMV